MQISNWDEIVHWCVVGLDPVAQFRTRWSVFILLSVIFLGQE
jgi:hypothetical protein